MFKLITRRPLWMNILAGLCIIVLIGAVFVLSLNWITQHGVARKVPSVTGKSLEEVQELLDKDGFELVIQDSVYYDSLPPLVVIKQVPEADAVVKVNRTVYVTVNRMLPPEIDMPNLVGYSFRNAEMILANLGLRLGDTTFRPDFAKGSILEQLYNGNRITPGSKIRMGSTISLVIGSGIGDFDMAVPKLLGLTYDEAKIMMEASGLILGSVIADPLVKDTGTAYVYRQRPDPKTEDGQQLRIRPGQMVDIWLSIEKPNVDSLEKLNKKPPATQEENDY